MAVPPLAHQLVDRGEARSYRLTPGSTTERSLTVPARGMSVGAIR